MDAAPGSPEEDDLELWSLLVEEYETKRYPVAPPDGRMTFRSSEWRYTW